MKKSKFTEQQIAFALRGLGADALGGQTGDKGSRIRTL